MYTIMKIVSHVTSNRTNVEETVKATECKVSPPDLYETTVFGLFETKVEALEEIVGSAKWFVKNHLTNSRFIDADPTDFLEIRYFSKSASLVYGLQYEYSDIILKVVEVGNNINHRNHGRSEE